MPNFEMECALVTLLLKELGLTGEVSDPKITYGRETGADVEVRIPGHRFGVQVTEYHGDEGERGSVLRAQEEADAKRGIILTYGAHHGRCRW